MSVSVTNRVANIKTKETFTGSVPHDPTTDDMELNQLSNEERFVFSEIARALKSIRYGSILLTVHEGRLVELSKTVRLRTNPAK